jgi:hypothetical protein
MIFLFIKGGIHMKKIMSLITVFLLAVVLVGCNNESLESSITDLETRIAELETNKGDVTTDLSELETKITQLKQEIEDLKTSQTTNTTVIEDLKNRLSQLEAQFFDGIITVVLEDEYGTTTYHSLPYKKADDKSLLELLDEQIDVDYETSTYGAMLNSIEHLKPKYGAYIAILENGEYSTVGIDALTYEDKDVFTFRVEWWDQTEQAVDTAIQNFISNYATHYITNEKVDYYVGSAFYHLGGMEDLISLDTVETMYQDLESASSGELFKAILIVSAAGGDPTDVNGNNLMQQLIDLAPIGQWNVTTNGAIALNAYSHAIDATNYETSIIDDLVNTNTPKSAGLDMGGITLMALAHYKDEEGVQTIIDEYVAFVKEEQLSTGGVNDPWSGDNAATLTQIILGLVANDIDPRDPQFTKENGDLLTRLLDFALEDGSFKLHADSTEADLMFSTPQAFAALVAYQEFKNSGEAFNLYEFN